MANLLLNKDGKLAKLTIKAFKKADRLSAIADAKFEAMFNPSQYTKKYTSNYTQKNLINNAKEGLKYEKSDAHTLSFTFLIDGSGATGEKVEVSAEIRKFLQVTYDYSGELKRPNYLKIFWGDEIASCVLKSADVDYSMFRSDGSPLRATIKATFQEDMVTKLKDPKARAVASQDKIMSIKEGDTLGGLMNNVYNDVGRIAEIANTNGLNSIRNIPLDSTILLPSFK